MFIKEEQKEKAEKPKVSTDSVMDEVMKEQKANLFATISEYVEDKTKVGELQSIINKAMDSAFRFGEFSDTAKTKGDEIIANMGNLFNNYLNPTNSKYKQLYDNQRMLADCLLQALRILQLQLSLNDDSVNPVLGMVSSILGDKNAYQVLEKENKE